MQEKLTKRSVDRITATDDRAYVFDSELPGFGIAVQPSGTKTFFVQYRTYGGRRAHKKRVTVGRYGTVTVDQARTRARELLADVTRGLDPAAARDQRRDSPTVRELGEDYLADVKLRRKARTEEGYRQHWENHVLPALASAKVDSVTSAQVAALHRKLRHTPYAANRVLALLGAFFTFAERQGVRPLHSNPARLVEPFREHSRERFLSPEETTRLGHALTRAETVGVPPAPRRRRKPKVGKTAKHRPKSADTPKPANPFAVAAIRFLLLSGWREREALTLKWSEIDLERGVAVLPDTKTGKSIRPLGAAAVELLANLPRIEKCAYAFPGRTMKADELPGPLVEINRVWFAVRHAAELDDVRLHDLRHSHASVIASGGGSLLMIRALLGHKDAKTTAKYAHLLEDPVKALADRTAAQLAALLTQPMSGAQQGRKIHGEKTS